LIEEEVLLTVPAGHRLAEAGQATIQDIADEPIITTRTGYWQRALVEQVFAEAGLVPNIVCEGDEPAATYDLIGSGLGVGLLPVIARETYPGLAVRWLHLTGTRCTRDLRMVWREGTYLSTAARHFRDYTAAHYQDVRHTRSKSARGEKQQST
jgi:DNA-binding transcriptional LysR family regulator